MLVLRIWGSHMLLVIKIMSHCKKSSVVWIEMAEWVMKTLPFMKSDERLCFCPLVSQEYTCLNLQS